MMSTRRPFLRLGFLRACFAHLASPLRERFSPDVPSDSAYRPFRGAGPVPSRVLGPGEFFAPRFGGSVHVPVRTSAVTEVPSRRPPVAGTPGAARLPHQHYRRPVDQ